MSQSSHVRHNWSRVLGSRVSVAHSGSEGLAKLAVGETPKTVKLGVFIRRRLWGRRGPDGEIWDGFPIIRLNCSERPHVFRYWPSLDSAINQPRPRLLIVFCSYILPLLLFITHDRGRVFHIVHYNRRLGLHWDTGNTGHYAQTAAVLVIGHAQEANCISISIGMGMGMGMGISSHEH